MARATDDFDQFVAANVDDLLRTAYLIAWDQAEAEDLVQECLLKVARLWPRVRSMDQPRAYARRILINLATDGARGRARRRVELDPVPNGGAERSVDPLAALEQLGVPTRATGSPWRASTVRSGSTSPSGRATSPDARLPESR
jgi:DNA-directed RNA polymerase specialized sigma24 family protein